MEIREGERHENKGLKQETGGDVKERRRKKGGETVGKEEGRG